MIDTSIYIIRITSNFEPYYMLGIVLSTFHSFIQQLIKHLIGAGLCARHRDTATLFLLSSGGRRDRQ